MEAVLDLILTGGPAALSAVLFFLFMQERKERRESNDRLLKVSNALIEHSTKTEAAITGFTALLENVGKTLQEMRDLLVKLKAQGGGT